MSSNDNPDQPSFNSDLTDGRKPGDWQTRYNDSIATSAIRWERNYLMVIFIIVLSLSAILILFLNDCSQYSISFCGISKEFKIYSFGFMGGMLGGTVFAMKWLYHSVAKNTWNIDRRLWRLMTPLLSPVVALLIVLIINTDLINNGTKFDSIYKTYAVGFLAGYFSDSAIGKLAEVAQVLFGSSQRK